MRQRPTPRSTLPLVLAFGLLPLPALGEAVSDTVRATRRLELAGLDASPGFLGALACVAILGLAGVILLYRREDVAKRSRARYVCAAIRCLALVALVALIVNPVRVTDLEREAVGVTVVLLDQSMSMSLRDSRLPDPLAREWAKALDCSVEDARNLPRWDLVKRLTFRPGRGLLDPLRRNNRVVVIPFADRASRMIDFPKAGLTRDEPGERAALPDSVRPDGASTDVAAAIESALGAAPEGLIAAIILVSDGQDNAPQRGDADPARAAAAAQTRGVPIYTVGVGDPSEPRNVALQNVLVNSHVLKGNPTAFRAVISQSGFTGRKAALRLYELTGEGRAETRRLLSEQLVELDKKLLTASAEVRPDAVGPHVYLLEVDPLPDEQSAEDNRIRKLVTVLDDRISVLLAAGYPAFEYGFLKPLLERTPGFKASIWLQSQDPRVPQGGRQRLERFPSSREDLLAYDLFILVDPSREEVSAEWLARVETLISERGCGLVWVAGARNTPRFFTEAPAPALTRLSPLLVDPDRVRRATEDAGVTGWKLELTEQGASAALTRLGPEVENSGGGPAVAAAGARFWEALPDLYWCFPAADAKPGAPVLLRYTDPRLKTTGAQNCPFLAVQFYGAGRVVHIGGDETWRWRKAGVEVHETFWLQLCRFAVQGRLQGQRRRAEFMTTQRDFDFGEPVPVAARLYDKDFHPLDAQEVALTVRKDGRIAESLRLSPAGRGAGVFEALFYPPGPGFFELECRVAADPPAVYAFSVKPPAGEMANTRLNEALLRKLSELSGGQYVTPEALVDMPQRIKPRVIRRVESLPPQPVWDRWALMALLLTLLTSEWGLRKWLGLL